MPIMSALTHRPTCQPIRLGQMTIRYWVEPVLTQHWHSPKHLQGCYFNPTNNPNPILNRDLEIRCATLHLPVERGLGDEMWNSSQQVSRGVKQTASWQMVSGKCGVGVWNAWRQKNPSVPLTASKLLQVRQWQWDKILSFMLLVEPYIGRKLHRVMHFRIPQQDKKTKAMIGNSVVFCLTDNHT